MKKFEEKTPVWERLVSFRSPPGAKLKCSVNTGPDLHETVEVMSAHKDLLTGS